MRRTSDGILPDRRARPVGLAGLAGLDHPILPCDPGTSALPPRPRSPTRLEPPTPRRNSRLNRSA
ncbi:hypothetical protein FAGKG844_20341 [Frankia sp. AgKG'84/4]